MKTWEYCILYKEKPRIQIGDVISSIGFDDRDIILSRLSDNEFIVDRKELNHLVIKKITSEDKRFYGRYLLYLR